MKYSSLYASTAAFSPTASIIRAISATSIFFRILLLIAPYEWIYV